MTGKWLMGEPPSRDCIARARSDTMAAVLDFRDVGLLVRGALVSVRVLVP